MLEVSARKISWFIFRISVGAVLLSATLFAQGTLMLTDSQEQGVDALIKQMTLQQKLDLIGGTGFGIRGIPNLGIRPLQMSDGPYGTRSNSGFPSTVYAAGIALAASWDTELADRVGEAIGKDARARGIQFMLGPGVNIYRSPRNGRNFEYFGEDPFLAASIAVGYIQGMQRQDVSAAIKHYIGNDSEFLRHDSDSVIEERALREIYLPAFEAAVRKAHVGAVMDSYNLINAKHATQNEHLNNDILRREWKFNGILMSDWDATYDSIGAANGGLDLEMPSGKFMSRDKLLPAIQAGEVSEAVIDDKVRHILNTAMFFGWLNMLQPEIGYSVLDTQNEKVALDSARESAVLLKNRESLLPLQKTKTKRILIVGPDAYPGVPVGGGSSGVAPFHEVSGLEGLSQFLGPESTVLYDRGLPTFQELVQSTAFKTEPVNGKDGVTDETFANSDLSGTPSRVSVDAHINLSGVTVKAFLADLANADSLFESQPRVSSHRFTGFYNAPNDGNYIIALQGSGEGSGDRVYLDGKVIVDNWKLMEALQPHVTLKLTAGFHKVVVEHWQTSPLGGIVSLGIIPEEKIVSSRALELARAVDAVVIEAGFQPESEGEGGDRTFSLPYGQDELIRAIAKANQRTIVVVTSGGNVDSAQWLDSVPVLLQTWYAGQKGGRALAEILFGEVNPSGHLPATFERNAEDNPTFANYYPEGESKKILYKEGIFVGYRGYEHKGTKPLFPFGFGLSYTSFEFSNLAMKKIADDGRMLVEVNFDLKNTGARKGADVAQVYVGEDHPVVSRPLRELKGFERIELAPGETKHVQVRLRADAFSYYNVDTKSWLIGSNKFTIFVGDSVEALPLKASIDSRLP
jgi:beta-glucosidase